MTDLARTEATEGEIVRAGEYRKVPITSHENESSQKGSFPPLCFGSSICNKGVMICFSAGPGQLARCSNCSELLELTRRVYLEINYSTMTDGQPNMV